MIETERLELREYRPTDYLNLYACMNDADVMKFLNTEPHKSPNYTKEWIEQVMGQNNKINSNGVLDFVIVLKETGTVIGLAGIDGAVDADGVGKIGFLLGKSFQGSGYMRETWNRLLKLYFEDVGILKLVTNIDPRNDASIRMVEKMGFKETGRKEKTIQVDGVWVDSVYHELQRNSWLVASHSQYRNTRSINTPNLLLRRYCASDIPFIHSCLSNPVVMTYWSTLPHTDLSQTEEWMNTVLTNDETQNVNGILDFIIYHKQTNQAIGKIGVYKPLDDLGSGEIGYLLHPDYWKMGLMAEAINSWVAYFFDIFGGQKLVADVDPRNTASLNLLKRAGFVETSRMSNTFQIGGEWVDSVYLSRLRV
ncbi:hypothetical protein HK100_001066 [Physocladia obscura]|uniref:N-acetyltransferase domain-containing protein n=1 Tax=Physocladia obscura TaxID=109957 RepID=A0AAD5T3F4_9FUNG|nr:hypothetical protein HK100_001066 [Physocladia obscura]